MNQNSTFQMNRRENNSNTSFAGERNPFQRNGRSENHNGPNGSNGYSAWKNRGQGPYNPYGPPPPPKEKVLTADDFPAFPGLGTPSKSKSAWDANPCDITLADRVKDVIAKEEEARLRGKVEEDEDNELYVIPLPKTLRDAYLAQNKTKGTVRMQGKIENDTPLVMPISKWQQDAYLVKKREEELKKREAELEEANYQWQISRAMFPPKPEKEMPAYEEDLEEQDMEDGYENEEQA